MDSSSTTGARGQEPVSDAGVDRDVVANADLATANVLERFYKNLFLAGLLGVGGACLWAIWSEWFNPYHDDHVQSIATALVLLAGTGVAAWQHNGLYELLRRRPAWVVLPTTICIVAIWIDGTLNSELYHPSLLLVGPIAVVTDARWAFAMASYLTLGYVVGLLGVNDISWSFIESTDQADAQLERIFAYLPVALLFVYPMERGASYVARSNQIIEDERERLQKKLRRVHLEARAAKLGKPQPGVQNAADGGGAGATPAAFHWGDSRATDELSAREVEVCQLVAEGLSNNDIAERLFLSPRTVQSHVANAMMKTHTASRTQLAVLMIRDGLVRAVHPGATDDVAAAAPERS